MISAPFPPQTDNDGISKNCVGLRNFSCGLRSWGREGGIADMSAKKKPFVSMGVEVEYVWFLGFKGTFISISYNELGQLLINYLCQLIKQTKRDVKEELDDDHHCENESEKN